MQQDIVKIFNIFVLNNMQNDDFSALKFMKLLIIPK